MADLNLQNLQNAAFNLSCLFEAAGHVPQNFLQYLNCHQSHATARLILSLSSSAVPCSGPLYTLHLTKPQKKKIQWR